MVPVGHVQAQVVDGGVLPKVLVTCSISTAFMGSSLWLVFTLSFVECRAGSCGAIRMTWTSPGPWTPVTRRSSMSPVLLGPVIRRQTRRHLRRPGKEKDRTDPATIWPVPPRQRGSAAAGSRNASRSTSPRRPGSRLGDEMVDAGDANIGGEETVAHRRSRQVERLAVQLPAILPPTAQPGRGGRSPGRRRATPSCGGRGQQVAKFCAGPSRHRGRRGPCRQLPRTPGEITATGSSPAPW